MKSVVIGRTAGCRNEGVRRNFLGTFSFYFRYVPMAEFKLVCSNRVADRPIEEYFSERSTIEYEVWSEHDDELVVIILVTTR